MNDDEAAAALEMADDRNLCVYLYGEALAEKLWARLPAHTALLQTWLGAMDRRRPG